MHSRYFLRILFCLPICFLLSCGGAEKKPDRWIKLRTSDNGAIVYSYDPASVVKHADYLEVLLKQEPDVDKDPKYLDKFLASRKQYNMSVEGFEHYRYQVQRTYINCGNGKSAVVGYRLYDDKDKVLETEEFQVEWTDYPEKSVLRLCLDEVCKQQAK